MKDFAGKFKTLTPPYIGVAVGAVGGILGG